uniref:C2H2-type domain-containing protein n=1 Tax=Rhipicephalus zambeziensis TaxID=60191 RepID=A0A224YGB2_9ACAR
MPSNSRRLSTGPYKCEPCNKSFTGAKSFAEHRDSKQHQRRTGEIPSVASPPSHLPSAPHSSQSQNPNSRPYQCMTCNKRFTGPESYAEHGDFSYDGKGCFAETRSSPATKNFVRCNACDTGISGVKNMKEHDKGKKHRNALAMLQGFSSVSLNVPTDESSSQTFTVYKDVPSSPLTQCAPSGQPDAAFLCKAQPLATLDSNTFNSNPHWVSLSSTSYAPRMQDCSTNNEGKHAEAVKPKEDRDQEQCLSFTSSESAEGSPAIHIAVKPVYSDDGLKCEVGGLKGYSCRKCGIVLFLNNEAAMRHYRTDSHSATVEAL